MSLAQRANMSGRQFVKSEQGAQVSTHRTFKCSELTSAAKSSCFLAQKSWESDLLSQHFMERNFVSCYPYGQLKLWQIGTMSARGTKTNTRPFLSFFLAQLSQGLTWHTLWSLEIMCAKPSHGRLCSKVVLLFWPFSPQFPQVSFPAPGTTSRWMADSSSALSFWGILHLFLPGWLCGLQ